MNPFVFIYTEFLFRPLLNLLVWITALLPGGSVGVAIIVVTVIVRILLFPSSLHQAKHMSKQQTKMKEVQDEIKQINEQYKDDPTQKAQKTMETYKKAGINPAGGCLPLLIQLPILIALYRVFLLPAEESLQYLYPFVPAPETFNTVFLGIDLTVPSILLGVLAGLGQFFLMRMTTKGVASPQSSPGMNEDTAKAMASMQKNMMYIFPIMTIFISAQLPAALALYWLASTIFAIGQQYYIKKKLGLETGLPVA